MSKYDEFDLDIQKTGNIQARGPVLVSITGSCVVTVCDTTFYTTTCVDMSCGCTASQQEDCSNTCSACHSYCGSAC